MFDINQARKALAGLIATHAEEFDERIRSQVDPNRFAVSEGDYLPEEVHMVPGGSEDVVTLLLDMPVGGLRIDLRLPHP